jgi:GGDEF domain-containing protein
MCLMTRQPNGARTGVRVDQHRELVAAEPGDADVSERLARALNEPFMIEGHRLKLGASIGRAAFPIDADDPDGLLRAADRRCSASNAGPVPVR